MIHIRRQPKPEPRRVLFEAAVSAHDPAALELYARRDAAEFYGAPAEIVGDYVVTRRPGCEGRYDAVIRLQRAEPREPSQAKDARYELKA